MRFDVHRDVVHREIVADHPFDLVRNRMRVGGRQIGIDAHDEFDGGARPTLTRANVKLSARNLEGVEVMMAKDVNVYKMLRYETVVVTKAGMDVIAKRLEGTGDVKK